MCVWVFVCVCVYMCMYVCMCVCVCVCVCACTIIGLEGISYYQPGTLIGLGFCLQSLLQMPNYFRIIIGVGGWGSRGEWGLQKISSHKTSRI